MTLRQLEAFLAIVKAGSFRRAAAALHLSQPTLSEHVRELEEELGIRLFDRTGRRAVALTAAGHILEEHALRLFGTLGDTRARIAELLGLERGSLVIGASTTPGIYVLPRLISAFRGRYAGIELSLRIANSRLIEERVRAGEFDLGVIGGHVQGRGNDCLAAGLDDELVLVVPPRHRWATRRAIEPARLVDEPLLMREEGSASRQLTERTLHEHGIKFRVLMELGHIEAIKQAVLAGAGVAFLSVHAVRAEAATRRLGVLRLRGLQIRRHFHVVQPPGRTLPPAARAFLELINGKPGARPRARRPQPGDPPATADGAVAPSTVRRPPSRWRRSPTPG